MPVKYIGSMGLGIGLAAFSFQATVLHPWHMRMNAEIETLRVEMTELAQRLREMEDEKIDLLAELESQIEERNFEFQRR